jgi:hypothetical protein
VSASRAAEEVVLRSVAEAEGVSVKCVQGTRAHAEARFVYDIQVDGDCSFFLEAGVISHNAPDDECPTPAAKGGRGLGAKAPDQVTPGVRQLEGQYVDDVGQVQPWRAQYDEYGRQVERTDFTDLPDPSTHTNPHHHTREYGPGYGPKGKDTRHPGPGPSTGGEQ